jgi:hypothetical protein
MSLALNLGEMTGWRLWHGTGGTSDRTAERVQIAYGLPVTTLRIPAKQNEPHTQASA